MLDTNPQSIHQKPADNEKSRKYALEQLGLLVTHFSMEPGPDWQFVHVHAQALVELSIFAIQHPETNQSSSPSEADIAS